MVGRFTVDDGSILCGLLADCAGDILLKTDAGGFMTEASPGLESFGIDLGALLIAPHIADIARGRYAARVRQYCKDALGGRPSADRIEFPACSGGDIDVGERWYALALRPTPDACGTISGAIGIMRSIAHRRSLEDEVLNASMTDQVTGLGNRHAFMSIMSRMLCREGDKGAMILFGVDRFRAITLNYGQSKGDEVLWAFAQFLRAMLGDEPILTRLEGERFAAILPEADVHSAHEIADEAIEIFARLSQESGAGEIRVSASAGIAAMAGDRDEVLANAELALTLSQAAGGRRSELGQHASIRMEQRRLA